MLLPAQARRQAGPSGEVLKRRLGRVLRRSAHAEHSNEALWRRLDAQAEPSGELYSGPEVGQRFIVGIAAPTIMLAKM